MKVSWHYIANRFSRRSLMDCGHHLCRVAIGRWRLDDQDVVRENDKHTVVIRRRVLDEIDRRRDFGDVEVKALLINFSRSRRRRKVSRRQLRVEITADRLQFTRDYCP